jgi:hypothetical protein
MHRFQLVGSDGIRVLGLGDSVALILLAIDGNLAAVEVSYDDQVAVRAR